MQNCPNFHSQLTSIMDILSKAAVAEISKLVEESYCAMRVEMQRSRSENDGLKRRLCWLERELMTARRSASHGSEPGECAHVSVTDDEAEEIPSFGPQQSDMDNRAQVGCAQGPEEQESCEEMQEQQSTECSDGGLGVLEFVVKPEHEEMHLVQDGGGRKSLSTDYPGQERNNQLWTSFAQESSDVDTDFLDCSHTPEKYPHSLSGHAESQALCTTVEGSADAPSSLRKSCELIFNTITIKEETEIHSQGKKTTSSIAHMKQEQYGGRLESRQKGNSQAGKQPGADGDPLGSNINTEFSIQNDDGSDSAKKGRTQKGGAGKKWFICTHCGKSLAYFSCYKVHLRSHTGEKPYRCLECGKSFTQQSNLTKHESVHSGKKPFSCSQCGKSFRHRYNLTLHQRVHSGEKPFHCTQCGKSFAQSCHFKRHQLCHEADRSCR